MNMNLLSNFLKDLIMQDYANIKVLRVCFILFPPNRIGGAEYGKVVV